MNPNDVRFTYIGGSTLLIEIGTLRFLTDPTFDAAGGDYDIGPKVLHKTGTPALSPDALSAVDAVLLSHDQHPDNLDTAGRALLPHIGAVITTPAAAERLQLPNVRGLMPWQSTEVRDEAGPFSVRITATPARHGPEGIEAILGDVTGFVLEWSGAKGGLYVSGDTVWFDGVAQIAERFPELRAAVLFLGGVRAAPGKPLLTMDAAEAVQAAQVLHLETIIPLHYDGWQHFAQSYAMAEPIFAAAGMSSRLVWLPSGEAQNVTLP